LDQSDLPVDFVGRKTYKPRSEVTHGLSRGLEQRMRSIRADLLERLNATVEQRRQLSKQLQILEARERCLRALVSDEERQATRVEHLSPLWLPSTDATDGAQLREFVLGSLADGQDWSLEQLKQHACGLGLTTTGASGRVLNIVLVNLLRQGSVVRLPNGRWRLRDQTTQSPPNLAPQRPDPERDGAEPGAKLAS
jgi:hypothetical protein